jgi:hypothetical protein
MLVRAHRSLRRALLIALALFAVVVPNTAQAASFTVTVERDTCVSGAGKYHLGQGVLRLRIIEYGKSGANKFTWVAQVWHLPIKGGKWSKEHEWQYTTPFPNDKASHYESRQFAYAPNHNAYHKIVVRVSAWRGTTRLYSKYFEGKTC